MNFLPKDRWKLFKFVAPAQTLHYAVFSYRKVRESQATGTTPVTVVIMEVSKFTHNCFPDHSLYYKKVCEEQDVYDFLYQLNSVMFNHFN